jgi:hypothetical protein
LSVSVSVMCCKSSSHPSLCSHYSTLSSSVVSKLLIAHTMSWISDLVNSFIRKFLQIIF